MLCTETVAVRAQDHHGGKDHGGGSRRIPVFALLILVVIVRAADGLPQDTRNASWLSYWLNYRLNYHAQLLAQLQAQLQNTTAGWPGDGSAVRGEGEHSVCVCVCVWYVSTLTLDGPDLRSSQIAIIGSQTQLACGPENTSVGRQSWWF